MISSLAWLAKLPFSLLEPAVNTVLCRHLHWLQNGKSLKLRCLFFSHFIIWNWRPLSLKSWHFEASEDIMTKFKSQVLYIIRIKYWNAGGSSNPPSLIPTLWNLGILLIKRPPAPNNMKVSVSTYLPIDIGEGFPLLFKGVITEFFRWDTAYVVGVTFSLWLW